MKKFIVTIISVLMLFTTSLVSTFASFEAPLGHEPTLQDVEAIYNDIFYNYKFDGNIEFIRNRSMTIKEEFERNVEFVKKNKVGEDIQLSYLLIDRLTNVGVKAVETTVDMWVGPSICRRVIVLYELEGKKYVVDLLIDKVYNYNKGKPMLFNIPLDEYLNFLKNELHEDVCGVKICKNSPQKIDKRLSEVEPGVDYDYIAIE